MPMPSLGAPGTTSPYPPYPAAGGYPHQNYPPYPSQPGVGYPPSSNFNYPPASGYSPSSSSFPGQPQQFPTPFGGYGVNPPYPGTQTAFAGTQGSPGKTNIRASCF